jgi:hypothetical protein
VVTLRVGGDGAGLRGVDDLEADVSHGGLLGDEAGGGLV